MTRRNGGAVGSQPCSLGVVSQGHRTKVRDECVQSGGSARQLTGSKSVLEWLGESAPVQKRLGPQLKANGSSTRGPHQDITMTLEEGERSQP
nr:hypothetical protein Iba_chr07cCG13430 [Ipomoea batatas]